MHPTLVDIVLTVVALVLSRWLYRNSLKQLSQPPGPPGLPLVGNVKDMPTEDAWLVYKRWSEQYGEPLSALTTTLA